MISANNITLRLGKKALFEDVNIKFTEEEFGVEIPSEELETLTTVGAVMNYLKEHGAEV